MVLLVKVLVVNAGSSSLKLAFFGCGDPITETFASKPTPELVDQFLQKHGVDKVDRIGFRVVHGGPNLTETVKVDAGVISELKSLCYLFPLHLTPTLRLMEHLGGEQYAVFDTTFHHTIPKERRLYPIPWKYGERRIEKFGFHGISYQSCVRQIEQKMSVERMILCHLGSGCSVCAIEKGQSVDTSMGYTPVDGVMMATRSGSIDPGVILQLMHHEGMSVDEVDHMLNFESGLVGICGISDFKELVESSNERAKLAYTMFVDRLCKQIGAYVALLGGVDFIGFTGGIGSHADMLIYDVLKSFDFLPIQLAEKREGPLFTTKESQVAVLALECAEEGEIYQQVANFGCAQSS
ncbi:MAG: Acetate kinase [Chlamydiia bacterium]|nr:Acetate kinase [Chlamydiia bacterium]